MEASERLRVAGEAAELLEEMGFTSVARLREGVVTLELWKVIGREQRILRHVVAGETTAAGLAELCSATFQTSVARGE
jgi:hypothetical protein